MLHKFIVVFKADGESLYGQIKDLFYIHARDYLELNSMIYDLQMYTLYLSEAHRTEILESLTNYLAAKVNLAAIKKMRATIGLNKLRY